MSHADAIQDLQATGIPGGAMPASEPHGDSKHEKNMVLGQMGSDNVTVGAAGDLDEDEEPTEEELLTLRKVPANMKFVSIGMCMIELAERASYYGSSGVFSNFVRGPLPVGGNGLGAVAKGAAGLNQSAGALNMGSVAASAVSSTFTFLAYVLPIVGGIVSDTKWGRFKTIAWGTGVGAVAHVLLVIPALPHVIDHSHGSFAAFMISMIILAFAAGFIKPCLGPLLCDQSPVKRPVIRTTKKGERVILDPQATVTRYLNIFYMCINIGAFFSVATSYSERLVGFWLAYLLPGIFYMLMPIVLVLCYKHLYHAPPQGSVVYEAYHVFKEMFKRGGFWVLAKGGDKAWNYAKPSYIQAQDGVIDTERIFWDDTFVEEIRQSLQACYVFFLIPIYNLADGAIGNQLNDMSVAMTLNGIPNDVINNFNPLVIIISTPILTWGIYPFFEKIGFPLRAMTRMCIGFMLGTVTMIISAIIQWRIYETSPCGYYATDCEAGVSPVSIGWLIPIYSLPAIGELFVNVTSYELAYTRAPARMKGLVYAICLFSSAISAAISLALSDVIQDPNLIWPYVAVACACFLCGLAFPIFFRHLNKPMRVFADPARQAGLSDSGKDVHVPAASYAGGVSSDAESGKERY
ncbi:putative integral membrane peptide transporter [Naematelia encephala]|uniref:Putative integral membrane peptide transporter n=1 Tax=Naematelia encephala TaxID=71784 RepID=A0A1Y2B998_9TREE|nr:putative integral membrane peptide transporter [Naematelia encephala]